VKRLLLLDPSALAPVAGGHERHCGIGPLDQAAQAMSDSAAIGNHAASSR